MSSNGLTGWKAKLKECERLAKESGQRSYDLAKLLTEVYDDQDWRVDNRIADDVSANDFLSRFCGCVNLDFLQLRAIYLMFPERKEWEKKSVLTMNKAAVDKLLQVQRDQKRAAQRERLRDQDTGIVEGSRVAPPTRVRELLNEREVAEAAQQDLAAQLAEAKSENAKLKAENLRLKSENDRLRAMLGSKRVPAAVGAA